MATSSFFGRRGIPVLTASGADDTLKVIRMITSDDDDDDDDPGSLIIMVVKMGHSFLYRKCDRHTVMRIIGMIYKWFLRACF